MITVEEADKIISQNIKKRPSVQVPLQNAFGMVLCENLIADRDLPPFNRVMMDGIGINLSAWEKGIKTFPVKGIQKAGIPALNLHDPGACFEVMTGAVLPDGCDCVVPYEDVEITDNEAKLREDVALTRMQYVHTRASDHQAETCLVTKGTRLLAPQVAVAASIGRSEVLVSETPRIAVVGTGDEVIGIDQKLEPYQVRQSNSYVIQAALETYGYDRVYCFHIRDDKDALRSRLEKMLKDFDVLILSGGVSRGKFDYIPEVLEDIRVKALFHQVKQRPGKPFWFGTSVDGKPVFALPGNPVSVQVGVYRYILPYLNAAANACPIKEEFALLGEDIDVGTDRRFFLPVKTESRKDGRLLATPVFIRNSGDFVSLVRADGFLELPEDTFQFPRGAAARFYSWKI